MPGNISQDREQDMKAKAGSITFESLADRLNSQYDEAIARQKSVQDYSDTTGVQNTQAVGDFTRWQTGGRTQAGPCHEPERKSSSRQVLRASFPCVVYFFQDRPILPTFVRNAYGQQEYHPGGE